MTSKQSVSLRGEVHSAFIQVSKGDIAMVNIFPPLNETEVLKGLVNLNNFDILGCIIAL